MEKVSPHTTADERFDYERRCLVTLETVIEASDLVFLSGGDVEEGMRVLDAKGMVGVLQRLHRDFRRQSAIFFVTELTRWIRSPSRKGGTRQDVNQHRFPSWMYVAKI